MSILPEIGLLKIKEIKSKGNNSSQFIIEPLCPGYGLTLGNSLRRVLLSSLSGSAITKIQIEGATHEFTTLAGVKEDLVALCLNLKTIEVKSHSSDPVVIELSKKGAGDVLAGDFKKSSQVEIVNPGQKIATLDKGGRLVLRATVEQGRGYLPVEKRREEKLPLGTIVLDAIFSPARKVHYEIENTRVEGETDFDRLAIDIETDGTLSPFEALQKSCNILVEYFGAISGRDKDKKEKIKKVVKKEKIKDKESEAIQEAKEGSKTKKTVKKTKISKKK